jgi:hypothetical protein
MASMHIRPFIHTDCSLVAAVMAGHEPATDAVPAHLTSAIGRIGRVIARHPSHCDCGDRWCGCPNCANDLATRLQFDHGIKSVGGSPPIQPHGGITLTWQFHFWIKMK